MIKKTIGKNGTVTVTFELPSAIEAGSAVVCGDFNDWSPEALPMKRRKKDGCFAVTTKLTSGHYGFKYLLDDNHWVNDWNADAYEPNGYGSENSVVVVD